MNRLDELARRHLDGSATLAEAAELAALLVSDPAAADRFAQHCRFEADLIAVLAGDARTATATARVHAAVRRGRRVRFLVRGLGMAVTFAAAVLLGVVLWPVETSSARVETGTVLVDGIPSTIVNPTKVFTVGGDAPARIRLPDGSLADLDPASRASIHATERGFDLDAGRGVFDVRPGGPFVVQTPVGDVTALGTSFIVNLSPGIGERPMRIVPMALSVVVLTGTVHIDTGDETALLVGGESRVFAADLEGGKKPGGDPGKKPGGDPGKKPGGDPGKKPGNEADRRGLSARGKLKSVTPSKIIIEDKGTEKSFELAKNVSVAIDRRISELSKLAPGMTVWLTRETETGPVTSIRVNGPGVGTVLKAVDAKGRRLTFPKRGANEGAPAEDVSLPVAAEAKVTMGGKPATLGDLKPGDAVALTLSADEQTILAVAGGIRREGEPKPNGDTGKKKDSE